jgi:hypothetical protein
VKDGIKAIGDSQYKGDDFMKIIKGLSFTFIVTVFTSLFFASVAFAEGGNVTVNNKSGQDVTVNFQVYRHYWFFEDPGIYSLDVDAGTKGELSLEKGEYIVSYAHCGDLFDFYLDLKDEYSLVLYPCYNQPTKIQVKSHLSEKVTLEIFGYKDYEVDINPGVKTKVNLFSGNIDYQYEACDGQVFTGELVAKKNGTTQLILHSCDWFREPARNYDKPNLSKFRIVNHASFQVIMTLIGPGNYLVTVEPGINVFSLLSGSYKYSYYQDLQLVTGSFVVSPNGNEVLVISPSYVMEYVDESQNLE